MRLANGRPGADGEYDSLIAKLNDVQRRACAGDGNRPQPRRSRRTRQRQLSHVQVVRQIGYESARRLVRNDTEVVSGVMPQQSQLDDLCSI